MSYTANVHYNNLDFRDGIHISYFDNHLLCDYQLEEDSCESCELFEMCKDFSQKVDYHEILIEFYSCY